jgi:hypothetical protein
MKSQTRKNETMLTLFVIGGIAASALIFVIGL